MFDNIPQELRDLSQWVVWKFETKPDALKATKVPYNVSTGWPASSTDPTTWTTFQNAVAASRSYDGIGFVLSENDPYCFIDLDTYDPTLTEEQRAEHVRIGEYFDGYIELSPSGKGYHLIVKGQVPAGRKRYGVEIYSSGRYMTMTGHVQRPGPIVDCQEQCDILWHDLAPNKLYQVTRVDQPQTQDDFAICNAAYSAINGQKFLALYQGEWNGFYPSQSEADFALIDILWFYTKNRAQVKRIWAMSKLYRLEKAGYHLDRMLDRASDRDTPAIDLDALKKAMDAVLAAHITKSPAVPSPVESAPQPKVDAYRIPNGLLGQITDYIYSSAPRQVPEIALAGAIALMSGICGRSYNIGNLGLNHYVLLLAPTGSGKEQIASGIASLMAEVERVVPAARDFIGPGQIQSEAALLKYISKKHSFISVSGEFGQTLQQMASPNGSAHVKQLKRAMLDLFGKSGAGNMLRPTIYSDAINSTLTVQSPAFSFLGESAPGSFYACVDENLIADGLLPRFSIIEYTGDQPPLNPNRGHLPSDDLVRSLAGLCAQSLSLNQAGKCINLILEPDAQLLLDSYEEICRANVNKTRDEGPVKQLWNRTHLRASKLAALYAIGLNQYNPIVTAECVTWACTLATHNTERLLERFESGEVGIQTSDDRHVKEVTRLVSKYIHSKFDQIKRMSPYENMFNERVVSMQYLQRACYNLAAFKNSKMGPNTSLRNAIKMLCDTGELIALSKMETYKRFAVSAESYAIGNVRSFGKV